MKEDYFYREIPENIQEHLTFWVKSNRDWRRRYYWCGTIATISAITVASNPEVLQKVPYMLNTIAWVSAISIALTTFLVPLRRAKGYVEAARVLTNAANRYRHDAQYTIEELLDAVKRGEELIAKGEEI